MSCLGFRASVRSPNERLGGLFFSFFRRENLPFEDPYLHTDDPISRLGLCQSVIDICPKGVKRNSTFPVPFPPGHFCPSQPSSTMDLDSPCSQFEGRTDGLL